MEYKDYYAILGVSRNAKDDEIKQAYRRLARKYHPDVSKEKNAEEQFKSVQEAYEVLKDPEKRSAYDQLGSNWKAGQEFKRPPNWDGGSRFYTSQEGDFYEGDLGGFSDFFSNLFGGGGGRRQAHTQGFGGFRQRGQDQHSKITITLEEAFRGTAKTLHIEMPEANAEGQIKYQTRTLKVNIPPGAKSGQQLRLAKQGGQGINADSGDLFLEIDIAPHTLFTLKDQDIYLTLPVTPWEAALGAEIKVPTLSGPVGLKLAAGSQGGQKLRLKGKGMPGKPQPGDQYAILEIVIPTANTEQQKTVFKTMAELMPFNPRQHWPG